MTKVIDWNNLNYPPWIKVIHLDPDDANNAKMTLLLKRMCVIPNLISAISFLNCIDSIILVASSILPNICAAYSVLNLLIFPFLSFFTLYIGYKSLLIPVRKLKVAYLVLQSLTCGLWMGFSIVDAGAFNGIMRIMKLFQFGGGTAIFCFILGIIESSGYLSCLGLGLYCIIAAVLYHIYIKTKSDPVDVEIRSTSTQ